MGAEVRISIRVMDGRHVGGVIRAARMRQNLTQKEVARRARVSQNRVSETELGRLTGVSFRVIEAICSVLDVRLRLAAWWHGMDAHRLLDSAHASIVEVVARELAALGWIVIPEYTFNYYGERGSVDIVAWMASTRSLLIIEVKSSIVDLQDLFAALGRKERVVPGLLLRQRGWRAATVSRVVALPGTTANRSIVRAHTASFDATLPTRTRGVRRWLRSPVGTMAGVWFISSSRVTVTKKSIRPRQPRDNRNTRERERGTALNPAAKR